MHAHTYNYFLAFGVLGTIVPFQPILLNAAGVHDGYLGLLLGAPGLITMGIPPLMGYLGDRHIVSRTLIAALFLLVTLCFLLLYKANSLPAIVGLNLTIACLTTPALALLDVVTLHTLRHLNGGADNDFPRFRRWGSIGFIGPALALYIAHDRAALSAQVVYLIGAAFALASCISALFLPAIAPAARNDRGMPTLTALRTLLRPPLRDLTGAMVFAFLGLAFLYLLLPRYLQTLGLSPGEAGLVISLGVVCEIALLSFGPRFIERIGLSAIIIAGVALTALRLGVLAVAPSLPVAILTQVLHGPLILVVAVALPILLTRHATPEIRNSIVGTALGINVGLLRLVGATCAGLIAALSPGTELERICVALAFGAALFMVATLLLSRITATQIDKAG